jgi:hypothetical protein
MTERRVVQAASPRSAPRRQEVVCKASREGWSALDVEISRCYAPLSDRAFRKSHLGLGKAGGTILSAPSHACPIAPEIHMAKLSPIS